MHENRSFTILYPPRTERARKPDASWTLVGRGRKKGRTELAHGPTSAVGGSAIAMRGRLSDARPQLEPHRRLGNRDRLKNKRPTNLKRDFTPLPSCSVDTSPAMGSTSFSHLLKNTHRSCDRLRGCLPPQNADASYLVRPARGLARRAFIRFVV